MFAMQQVHKEELRWCGPGRSLPVADGGPRFHVQLPQNRVQSRLAADAVSRRCRSPATSSQVVEQWPCLDTAQNVYPYCETNYS